MRYVPVLIQCLCPVCHTVDILKYECGEPEQGGEVMDLSDLDRQLDYLKCLDCGYTREKAIQLYRKAYKEAYVIPIV